MTVKLFPFVLQLLRPFWPLAAFATLLGAASGVATAWLLSIINGAFHAPQPFGSFVLAFVALVAFIMLGEILSDLGNSYIGQHIVARLRKDLTDRVLSAPIDRLERFRLHRVIAALDTDVDMISVLTFNFSSLAIAFAVTLGCIVYLVILSPMLFAVAAIALAIGMVISTLARRRGLAGFDAARNAEDDLQKHYRSITDGAKELRLNRQRRAHLRGTSLTETIDRLRDAQIRAMRIFMSANALSDAVFWSVIALLIGLQSALGIDLIVISGFVLVLLYVKGPLDQLLHSISLVARAHVSMKRIAEISREFDNPEPRLLLDDASLAGPAASLTQALTSIDLVNATYAFPAPVGGQPFALGPITLSVRSGEITFIVGENGSGKTTFIKLLLGLYAPQSGKLLVDGEEIGPEMRDDYRQLFSAVFFDYYLFDDIVAPGGDTSDAVAAYLERLEIAHKVSVVDGRFTTTDLSTGQKKRLALIHAYLEARPVMIFDEWAAEQDPTFRRIFYEDLLPDLKTQGKTLIVISHDDRYFGAADRLIRLERGQVVEDRRMQGEKAISGF